MLDINIPLQPKQFAILQEAERAKHTIIGVGGSRGSTKSHAARSIMLQRRLKYPGTTGVIFRRKRKQLLTNHLENGYFKQWPFMREWWNESKFLIRLPHNNSIIRFYYAEHPTDIDDFQGDEAMDVMIDEASRLTELELQKMNAIRRWTGKFGGKPIPNNLCKTFWLMNPGGPGHNYIRRLMYKREFRNGENPDDYVFFQMFAWDNVEWCRSALDDIGVSVEQYYTWTNEQRYKFFISRTQYGRELNALPQRLRTGWLLGNWDEFAGQFFDIWDEERHVVRCSWSKPWHPIWLGIDWGFQHPCSCHWMSQEGPKTKVYREHLNNLHSARAQALEIVDKTPKEERSKVEQIFLSPDAFQTRSEQDSFAEQMGAIFRQYGMPYPTPADDDRKHGAQACYELMSPTPSLLEVDPSCKRLIEVMPMICTEEDDPEEIEKFEGDDAFDSFRYGVKSRQRPSTTPVVEVAAARVAEYAKARKTTVEDLDPNVRHSLTRRALVQARKARSQRRGGLGRIWRPQERGA